MFYGLLLRERIKAHQRNPEKKGILTYDYVVYQNPDLVVRDDQGKPFTVRYDAVNAMLLNEFLKEQRRVQDLESALEQLSASLQAQDLKIQKMSDQLAAARIRLARPPLEVVINQ